MIVTLQESEEALRQAGTKEGVAVCLRCER